MRARLVELVILCETAWALVEGRKIRKPTAELVAVTLEFRCATERRCDVDNMVKLILDAGNGVVWVDDQQVARLVVDVYRSHPKPGTTILAEVLSRGTLTR